jgi:hypothetical protein
MRCVNGSWLARRVLDLVFPNGVGKVETRTNITNRGLIPVQIAAGVCTIVKDDDGKVVLDDNGKPVRKAKYGMHALRHFLCVVVH